jgi:hypothetical protein
LFVTGLFLTTLSCTTWSISREFFAGPIGSAPPSVVVLSGDWKVTEANGLAVGMPAVEQTATSGSIAGLCLHAELKLAEGAVQVHLQNGGGVVWGACDGGTYRVCELDRGASVVRVLDVNAGIRREVAVAAVDCAQDWMSLRVDVVGDSIACQVDGATRLALELPATLGRGVGLWTAPGSTARFADFAVVARR